MTKVINKSDGLPIEKISYELEIEILKFDNIGNLNDFVENIYKLYLNTHIIYTNIEKQTILNDVNFLLSGNRTDFISNDFLSQPKNLKYIHLTDGYLIEKVNYPITSSQVNNVIYSATVKADGKRTLMFIDKRGIYFIETPNKLIKLVNGEAVNDIPNLFGYLLEGEMIDIEKTDGSIDKKIKYIYLIYDCLAISRTSNTIQQGIWNVQHLKHSERIKYLASVVSSLKNLSFLRIEEKNFYIFRNSYEFFRATNKILDEYHWFNTDGIIFTPNNIYKTRNSNDSMNDFLKWKPEEKLTIDFEILKNENGFDLLYYDSRNKTKISFKGNERYTFNVKDGLIIDEKIKNVESGQIIEFRPIKIDGKIMFKFDRIREDKLTSNNFATVNSIWNDIHDPITENCIRGKEFKLVFKYHNKMKKELYSEMSKILDSGEKTLICIGSGRGGDIEKWSEHGFTKVLCVEPNKDNASELKKRLEKNGNIKYKILETVGQNVELIFEEYLKFFENKPVDAIVYMLSLSFFFDTWKSFVSIIKLSHNVVKPGGLFSTFTIDGYELVKYFEDPNNYYSVSNQNSVEIRLSKLNFITLRYIKDNDNIKIFINIPNSIVNNQEEYLTNLKLLVENLSSNGFELLKNKKANTIDFLNEEEKIYTTFFRSLLFKKNL